MFSLLHCSFSLVIRGSVLSDLLLIVGTCWSGLLSKTLSESSLESVPGVAAVALFVSWLVLLIDSGRRYSDGSSELRFAVIWESPIPLTCPAFLCSMRRDILSSSFTVLLCIARCFSKLSMGCANLAVGVVVEILPWGSNEVLVGSGRRFSREISGLAVD